MEQIPRKSIDVTILGQSVRIKHHDEAYIRKVENYVNEQLEVLQKQHRVPSLQLAARLLLIVVDEFFSIQKENEILQKAVSEKARRMISLLDEKACVA